MFGKRNPKPPSIYIGNHQYFPYSYKFNPILSELHVRWNIRRDWRKLRESGYAVIEKEELTQSDQARLKQLYESLYIQKYSNHNVQYRNDFFSLLQNDPQFQLKALKKDGRIDAFCGINVGESILTAPLIGYDRSLPKEYALYPMITSLITKEGHSRNKSAGVARFKRTRGAFSRIEYHMVYTKHLPVWMQSTWWFLQQVLHKWAIPYMKKHHG